MQSYKEKIFISQVGFINVVALLLLVGGIIAGTYLVQQRTNLLPKAQEAPHECSQAEADTGSPTKACEKNGCKGYQYHHFENWTDNNGNGEKDSEDSFSCSWTQCTDLYECPAGTQTTTQTSSIQDGQSCQDNPSGATRPAGYKWVADCSKSCTDFSNHSQCPKNDSDPQNVKPETSRWCYNFKEGGRCLQLKASSQDPGLSSQQASQNISQMNQTQACTNGLKTHLDSKVAIRLALYYAIIQGVSEACVKADLGLDPQLTAQNEAGTTGRLFLCSGKESKPGSLILKWRIDTGTDGTLEQVKNPPSTDPNNLPNKDHVKRAEELLKVTAPTITTSPTAPTDSSTSTPASDELKAGGKECIYTQGDKCYKGNCRDGSQNCGYNDNCGYIEGYSSGEETACQ